MRGPRTAEDYLRASVLPRYMQRLREIDDEYRLQRRGLERAYRTLLNACGADLELFSRAWRAEADAWPFERLNELIREHNRWYPLEASLPMDPRTRDYVRVGGGSYQRVELDAKWVLEHLPDVPRRGAPPDLPARAPRRPC